MAKLGLLGSQQWMEIGHDEDEEVATTIVMMSITIIWRNYNRLTWVVLFFLCSTTSSFSAIINSTTITTFIRQEHKNQKQVIILMTE